MARITLSTHWKFQRLARAVGSKVLARGILETLWEPCWLVGEGYVGTSADIEALCEWKGEKGALTKALLMPDAKKAGFIEPYEGSVRTAGQDHYQIHNFLIHCPEYVRKRRDRVLDAKERKVCAMCKELFYARNDTAKFCGPRCRMRAHRGEEAVTPGDTVVTAGVTADPSQSRNTGCNTNTDLLHRGCNTNAPETDRIGPESEVCYTPLHPVTAGDGHQTKLNVQVQVQVPSTEEKNSSAAKSAAEPDPPGKPKKVKPTPPLDDSPIVLTFPVVGEPGPWWHLHESQVARWHELYPHVDIIGQAKAALGWVEANQPKTAGGMRKFLVAWLNRSVNYARGSPRLITGSLKTAGNKAAGEEILRRRGHAMD